jgi:hypothetical protein
VDRVDVYRMAAPLISATSILVAGKAISAGYRAVTGKRPPQPDDLEVSTLRVMAFAVGSAAAFAMINAGIQRSVATAALRRQQENLVETVMS